MAGFRPGFGRGGITHSFLVTPPVGVPSPDIIEVMFDPLPGLVATVGGAGKRAGAGGEPADEGVETAGDAMAEIVII